MTAHVNTTEDEPSSMMPPLSAQYQPPAGAYDEFATADGGMRPHWQTLVDSLQGMRPAETRRRRAMAERLIHESGISYNVFADPEAIERSYEFDGIPLILPADEWRALEAGLIQRAKLLNALLADIYGPRTLVKDGTLPPALVLGNPQFLRPCHGLEPPCGTFLHRYAADLARGPDGRWRILRDSTESPTGSGYALENRVVLSQSFAEAYQANTVRRLAGHFLKGHEQLVAATSRPDPRIVLLTPGPENDDFFTHAYLARYLGYSLAEGDDLTIRSDRVFLKTVEGLVPVDAIVRGIDSADSDPLALKATSLDGAAGLTRAAMAGSVVVSNALGSAVLECEALLSFMPGLCRRLLGEDLLLDTVQSWWCGDPAARDHVRANLDRLMIRPTFRRRDGPAQISELIVGSELDEAQRTDLLAAIDARGYDFVGQEKIRASTAPVLEGKTLRPRPFTLRAFVAASDDGYDVMPGGLARISATEDARAVSVHHRVKTKDTWVLSDGPVPGLSLLRTPLSIVSVRRTGKDLPSRAADNLFWLGRYAERAEGLIRVSRAVLTRLTDGGERSGDSDVMSRLLQILMQRGGDPEDGRASRLKSSGDNGLVLDVQTLLYAHNHPYGLNETMGHLGRTAALARDRLSFDAWRTLNDNALTGPWQRRRRVLRPASALVELNAALMALSAFNGLEMENMTRSHGWRFLDLGRRIERAVYTAEMLRGALIEPKDGHNPGLVFLLDVADSFMTYRSRYMSTPYVAPVLDLLMLDETNPRSLAHQHSAILDHVDSLPAPERSPLRSAEQKLALAMLTDLRLADIGLLSEPEESGRREELDMVLTTVIDGLPQLSESIARSYFSHAEATHTGFSRTVALPPT